MLALAPPTADDQVRLLRNIQRLLEETRTSSTYKYALLLALADLSVEYGDDPGTPLRLSTDQIAAKFTAYYWQQTLPFETASGPVVLRQNPDRPPRILTDLIHTRAKNGDSLQAALRDKRLIKRIEQTVRNMPLSRLQKIGGSSFEFLYTIEAESRAVMLPAGVAFCFRRFHGLIQDLVRGAWLRFVRELNANDLGSKVDLEEFLFGSRRASLAAARRALDDVSPRRCFLRAWGLSGRAATRPFRSLVSLPWQSWAQFRALRRPLQLNETRPAAVGSAP